MSGVNIRINASFYEDDVQEGTAVVGNIYSTDKRGGGRRNVMIPMGPNVSAGGSLSTSAATSWKR